MTGNKDFKHKDNCENGTVRLSNPQIENDTVIRKAKCDECGMTMWQINKVVHEEFTFEI